MAISILGSRKRVTNGTKPVFAGLDPAKIVDEKYRPAPSGGGGGGGSGSVQTTDTAAAFNALLKSLYAQFKPAEVQFETRDAVTLRETVASWLRPAYEQAVLKREERTRAIGAELDADAIARGMGTSTYVTDVKARQLSDEAEDILSLESEYGAKLMEEVSAMEENDRQRALETDMFNTERAQQAYEKAFAAAQKLYAAYRTGGSGGGGGGGGDDTSDAPVTSPENCAAFLSGLTERQRDDVYYGSSETSQRYRDEIIASVGYQGYLSLITQYPSRYS